MPQQLVLVIGGIGLQGSGCLKDLQSSKQFRLRTITRNARSKAAMALAAEGVEVLQGNLLDLACVEQAMQGVHSLFLVTFSEHDDTEYNQGVMLANAAVHAGVELVIFSGGERTGVDGMDNKYRIEMYLRGLSLRHVIYLHTAFFYENLATKQGTRRVTCRPDGSQYHFSIPIPRDLKISFISPTDIGRVAAACILQPTLAKHGDVIPIAGDIISPQAYVECFARLKGVQADYRQLELDVFRRMPIPGAEKIAGMYEWYQIGCIRSVLCTEILHQTFHEYEAVVRGKVTKEIRAARGRFVLMCET